jgi:hypothetical protein
MMTFTDMLMVLAAWMSPKDRKDWAQAMRGEYSALTRGRVGWALGCLTTAAGWRLKVDGLWLVALCVMSTIFVTELQTLMFRVHIWALDHWIVLPGARKIDPVLFRIETSVPFVLWAATMGAWRPNRTWITATLLVIVSEIETYVRFAIIFPEDPSLRYIHWNDLPPIAGELAFWTLSVASVWVGAQIGRMLRRPRHIHTN